MRLKTLIPTLLATGVACLALSACGPSSKTADAPATGASGGAAPAQEGPAYDGVGVVAAIKDQTVTIDSEAVPAAGLTAGRHDFTTYADVMAEAPAGDGARVAYSFRKSGAGYDFTALKAR